MYVLSSVDDAESGITSRASLAQLRADVLEAMELVVAGGVFRSSGMRGVLIRGLVVIVVVSRPVRETTPEDL